MSGAVRESLGRVGALMVRHLYLIKGSWPRLLELAYWPLMQMLMWGFFTVFLREQSSWVAQAAGVLISGVLLWDVLFRSNLGFAISFLEEMWSRNFGQLFISPLRPFEFILALMGMSAVRTVLSVGPAALLSLPLFDVWIFSLGPGLIAFFVNLLVMGWCVGMVVSGLVLRYGMGAEGICWAAVFIFAPLSGVYYPISVLPDWLEPVSWALPSAYVFEGMRAVLFEGVFRTDYFLSAVGLNVLYLALSAGYFLRVVHIARVRGLLLQQGE